jgi:type I restriction enzyme S subunit
MTVKVDKRKLPEGWKWVKLGEVITFIKGKVPNKLSNIQEHSMVIYLSPEYLRGNVNETFFCSVKDVILADNDIIILFDGSNAGEIFFAEKGAIASTMAKVDIKSKFIDKIFLYYVLKSHERLIKSQIKGSGIPHVEKNIFEQLFIPLPPFPEQRKIAEVLETIDNAIKKTDAIIEKYKRIKRGLMQDLLTKGIDENGNIRDEKTHKFKDSPLGRIPEEWEVVRLGEVVENTYPGEWGDDPTDDRNIFPVFSTIAIDYDGRIDLTKAVPRKLNKKKIEKLKLRKGMILIEKSGGSTDTPAGKVAVLKQDFEGTCSNFVQILKPNNNICNSYYLFYRLLYNFKNNLTEKYQQRTTGIINFILKEYFNEYIPLPPLPEQHRIAEILSQIDQAIEKEQAYKEKLERIKKGLMEDLLTGKVRVNHLIEEEDKDGN